MFFQHPRGSSTAIVKLPMVLLRPLLLPDVSPWPRVQLCRKLEEETSAAKAEVTRAVPSYRAWQGRRSRRPCPCSRVSVRSALGAIRPCFGVQLCRVVKETARRWTYKFRTIWLLKSIALSCCVSPQPASRTSPGKRGRNVNSSPQFICQAALLALSSAQVAVFSSAELGSSAPQWPCSRAQALPRDGVGEPLGLTGKTADPGAW